jgi:hypothetical protein
MNIVYKARIFLIRFAKVFPFVLCGIICFSYTESVYALLNENYMALDDSIVLDKPLSRFIGEWFVYDWRTIAVATIFSLAFETCWHNKACIIFACVNAWERDYFLTIELEPTYIYLICLANIIVAGYLTIKGISILTRKQL